MAGQRPRNIGIPSSEQVKARRFLGLTLPALPCHESSLELHALAESGPLTTELRPPAGGCVVPRPSAAPMSRQNQWIKTARHADIEVGELTPFPCRRRSDRESRRRPGPQMPASRRRSGRTLRWHRETTAVRLAVLLELSGPRPRARRGTVRRRFRLADTRSGGLSRARRRSCEPHPTHHREQRGCTAAAISDVLW